MSLRLSSANNNVNLCNYINGELTEPFNKNYLDVINPATEEVYTKVPNSTKEDLQAAISSAKLAQDQWQNTNVLERADWLRKIANGIKKYSNELAIAECKDTGKPINLAKNLDIPRAAYNFEFYADAITSFDCKSYPMDNNCINYTTKEPLGVVACISPWNLPLYLLTWKIAPALVTGNSVIAKPSEITPYTASLLAEICSEIKLPNGVLNILHGEGQQIGEQIINHPDISAISFTGGTKTGAHIAKVAGQNLKKLSLELGGKNPAIILDDCNIDKTAEIIAKSAFTNQGQICLCNSRIYVQDSIYDEFKLKFIDTVSKIKIGDPEEPDSQFGSITSKQQFDKILGYIEYARQERCQILLGGNSKQLKGRCANGYFIEPTIIDNVQPNSKLNMEEIFGPVITINSFNNVTQVIELANNTEYGLAASIFTNNISKAQTIAHKIKSGIVWINSWMVRDLRTPFGGMKNSGLGREGGEYSLNFFTELKNICINYD